MASSIISFPDLNNLLFYKNRYIKPVLTDDDYGYYILNDTEDTYILTNVSPTNKKINIEAFVVGGGGAGGYYNGNGGDGGTVIYKSLSIDPNTTLELTVGKGAFYVSDTRYNNGFLVKLYEGFITDFFETQKSYLMNMKPTDTITNGLNKIWEQKVNSIASLKTIIENDVESEIITNINQNEICKNDPSADVCEKITKMMFTYNKGFTFNIYSVFFAPYNCDIEIEITAFQYSILFFYSYEDIKYKYFSDDLTLYQTFSNTYWMKISNETKIFTRKSIKASEQYYLKIVYTQDKELSAEESQFNVNISLITPKGKIPVNYNNFKFNNSADNYGIIYSTPSTIFNKNKEIMEINAIGGMTGLVNPDTINYGKGGCSTYQLETVKKIKKCSDNTNGANGTKLPNSFHLLKNEPYNYTYTYGSGGGGAFWRLTGYGGRGGANAGNGISFTNLPSISRPTINTGGGGGGNSFLNNYGEKMLDINKLSGASGIIILKVNKKTEQVLVQTFANKESDEIETINTDIEKIYKENKLDTYDATSFPDILTEVKKNNIDKITTVCNVFFKFLFNRLKEYETSNTEKERLKFPIIIIYDKYPNDAKRVNLTNGNYFINLYTDSNISISDNEKLRTLFHYYEDANKNDDNYAQIEYNPNFQIENTKLLRDTNYDAYYIKKLINNILDKNKLVLFTENVAKHYFYFYKTDINIKIYKHLKSLIVENKNNATVIADIDSLTATLTLFNNDLKNFTPNTITDTEISERTNYIDTQDKFKIKAYNNSVDLITSNNITNYSINHFKTKYNFNRNDYIFNIIFYITIIIIIVVCYYTYTYYEIPLRPLVIFVSLIITLLLIAILWSKSSYDLKIYENFECNANKTGSSDNVVCLTNNGTIINQPAVGESVVIPYYFISKDVDNTNFLELLLVNSSYVDIFIYGMPLLSNNKYYLPNIDIYKNVLLTKNFKYKIFNKSIDKIDILSANNAQSTLISAPAYITDVDNSPKIKIYDCKNLRKDLCSADPIRSIPLNNSIYTTYAADGTPTTSNGSSNNILGDIDTHYDFDPPSGNDYNKYGKTNIKTHVFKNPFIVIKITNDTIDTTVTIDESINKFKKEINIFEINTALYLYNKNTKKIVDFTKDYHIYNNRQYADEFIKNSKIYDRTEQARHILNREILHHFYSKFIIAVVVVIILCCLMLNHYLNNYTIYIMVFGIILTLIATIIIIYEILKHQRIDSNKYYFSKPHNYK